MKKALIILFIVLLILIGAPLCYLFLSGGSYNAESFWKDPKALTPAERYSVNTQTRTIDARFSEEDFICILNQQLEGNIFDLADEYGKPYSISLQKAGMVYDGDSITVYARLLFKDFLPIPLQVDAKLITHATQVEIVPDTISVGPWIHVSVSSLPFSLDESLSYDFSDMHPFFKEAFQVTATSSGITATIPYPLEWLMDGMESFPSDYTMIVDLVNPDELDTLLPEFLTYTSGDKEITRAMVDACAGHGEDLLTIKRYAMAFGSAHASVAFFAGDGNEYNDLLFPDLTKGSVTELRDSVLSQYQSVYDERAGILSDAFQYLLDGYAAGTIIVKNKKLVYNEKGFPEVSPDSIPALSDTGAWLNLASFRCILARNGGDYSLRQVPKGNLITAYIFRTLTDRPVVAYRYTSDMFKITSLTEKDYASLFGSAGIPTYDLGMDTTKR